MKKEYKNGFLGWLFDTIILISIISPFLIFQVYKSDGVSIFAIVVYIIAIISTTIYHTIWKNKLYWISPGEHFIAVRYLDSQKNQTNPFQIKRLFLYIVLVINFLNIELGDQLLDMTEILTMAILLYLYNAMILTGALLMALAKISGLILLIIPYLAKLLLIYATWTEKHFALLPSGDLNSSYSETYASQFNFYMIYYSFFILINIIVGIIYYRRKNKITE